MKRILVLSDFNSVRGPIAQGYLNHFKKCNAEIYSIGMKTKNVNANAIKVMAMGEIDINSNNSISFDELNNLKLDYAISLSDKAKVMADKLPASTLKFHYQFNDLENLNGSDEEVLKHFITLRDIMKLYIEKFCKIYLNEYH